MESEQSSGPRQSNLRILLVSDLFAPKIGGVCAVAEALAANLAPQVTVAAPKSPNSPGGPSSQAAWLAYDRRFPFAVHRVERFETVLSPGIPGRLRGPLQFAWNALWTHRRTLASLSGLLANHSVDVLCINTLSTYWLAPSMKRHCPQMKVVFYLHGEEVAATPHPRRIDRYSHQGLRAADAVVVVSAFTRDRALRCGVDASKIHIIHNGVDTARFTPGPKDAALVARFGLQDKKVLLCLARLDERKGQDMLLQAMPTIVAAVPDAVLLIVGGGTDEARLRALAVALGLGDCVVFAGVASDNDVVAYYRTADIYVMPNRETDSGDTEGFGLVFLEAGACAKPVIGGRAGGVPDAIVDGETGYLVDGRSAGQIAEACIRLLNNPELAARLGQNGCAHSARTTWECQAARFLALCETLCGPDPDQPPSAR